jgi:hypothetical protein
MDSWHNGGTVPAKKSSMVALTTKDGTIINLAEANSIIRQDPINWLSNRNKGMPRLSTPDHRVKIARYGDVRAAMKISMNKWGENRNNSYLDHTAPINLGGELANKILGMLILDAEGQRSTKHKIAKGTNYSNSKERVTKEERRKINPEELMQVLMLKLQSQSQPNYDNTMVGNNRPRRTKSKMDVRGTAGQSKLNHHVIESMSLVNRTLGPKEAKDLRNRVNKSAADNGLYHAANNKSKVGKTKDSLNREGLDTRHIEETRTTKNYGGLKPMKNLDRQSPLDFELYKNSSSNTLLRSQGKTRSKHKTKNDNIDDIDMPEFGDAPARKINDSNYNGRCVQSDHGDIAVGESTGDIDIHETLNNMIGI